MTSAHMLPKTGGAGEVVAAFDRTRCMHYGRIGATNCRATDSGNLNMLIAATIIMADVAAAINRLLWRRLCVLAETIKIEV
jgi:ABC-type anion transport system duplicated permease subunit